MSDQISTSSKAFLQLASILKAHYEQENTSQGGDSRVILVLGDGAAPLYESSKSATIKERILNIAESHGASFVEEAWDRLHTRLPVKEVHWDLEKCRSVLLERANIGDLCSVACENNAVDHKVRQFLCEEYSPEGAPPHLAYEIVAHLLKHRFADHIISFNIDDVQDITIENELGSANYDLIFTEQQAFPQGTANKPRIVKLHGSATAPKTLRFRTPEIEKISPAIAKLLATTVFGASDGTRPSVHLVSLGYSWSDAGFVDWVISQRKYIESVTIIRRGQGLPDFLKKRLDHIDSSGPNLRIHPLSIEELTPSDAQPLSAGDFLRALFYHVEELIKEFPLVPISRHLLLSEIFEKAPQTPHSSESRFRVELLLHLIKCKGMINISTMANDQRLDRYHRQLAPVSGDIMRSIPFIQPNAYHDVPATFFSRAQTVSELAGTFIHSALFNISDTTTVPSFDNISGKINTRTIDVSTFILDHVTRIFDAPQIEITPRADPTHGWLFERHSELETLPLLHQATRRLFNSEWSHVLVIAENGSWLAQDYVREILQKRSRSGKDRILLLRSSPDRLDQWHIRKDLLERKEKIFADMEKENYETMSGELSWWEHNRHITLFIDTRRESDFFVGGIYYYRRLKASQVSPTQVSTQGDCVELLIAFLSYLVRACEQNNYQGNVKLAAYITNELGPQMSKRLEGSPLQIDEGTRSRVQGLLNRIRHLATRSESLQVARVERARIAERADERERVLEVLARRGSMPLLELSSLSKVDEDHLQDVLDYWERLGRIKTYEKSDLAEPIISLRAWRRVS